MVDMAASKTNIFHIAGCGANLFEPFIRCMQCPGQIFVCLHCFAQGLEKETHQNNHDFEVVVSKSILLK